MRAWKLHFLFGKCVLRQQPEVRGGKKKKLKRNETLRAGLMDRLGRWNGGKVDELWSEARKLHPDLMWSTHWQATFAVPPNVLKTVGMVRQLLLFFRLARVR
jgi:hypothetical protein